MPGLEPVMKSAAFVAVFMAFQHLDIQGTETSLAAPSRCVPGTRSAASWTHSPPLPAAGELAVPAKNRDQAGDPLRNSFPAVGGYGR